MDDEVQTAAVGAEDGPDAVDALLRGSGLDNLDLDCNTLFNLAAITLTNAVWRNTEVEDAHVRRKDLHDAEMMLGNLRVWRIVRRHLSALTSEFDSWVPMAQELMDPHRQMLPGRTQKAVLGPFWPKVRDRISLRIGGQYGSCEELGYERWLRWCAVQMVGGGFGSQWYGTPWWPQIVAEFTASIAGRDDLPVSADTLSTALRDEPDALSLDCLRWCLRNGLWGGGGSRAFLDWRDAHLHPDRAS